MVLGETKVSQCCPHASIHLDELLEVVTAFFSNLFSLINIIEIYKINFRNIIFGFIFAYTRRLKVMNIDLVFMIVFIQNRRINSIERYSFLSYLDIINHGAVSIK